MTTLIFLLVISSTILHAGWNFFSKKVSGNLGIVWVGSVISNLILLPYTLWTISKNGIDSSGIIFIILSIIIHLFYYINLFGAYKIGDISAAYPIARGTSVAITAFIGIVFMKEKASLFGLTGIILIISGIISIGVISFYLQRKSGEEQNRAGEIKTLIFALRTGICTSAYSIVDSIGVGFNDPIVYLNIMDIMAYILFIPFAFKPGYKKVFDDFRKHVKESLIIGIGGSWAYILILFAFRIAKQVSYIAAMREFSVVIASILGFIVLKEKPTIYKIAGIVMITLGLMMIKIG